MTWRPFGVARWQSGNYWIKRFKNGSHPEFFEVGVYRPTSLLPHQFAVASTLENAKRFALWHVQDNAG